MENLSQSQACPICLVVFGNQVQGVLDSCKHCFCLECIIKWSKTSNVCPIDRKNFKVIEVTHEGIVVSKLKCTSRRKKKTRELYDVTTICEVCQGKKCDGVLLLCDACNLAYHMGCLKPPLSVVPPGEWYCPTCSDVFKKTIRNKNARKAEPVNGVEMKCKPMKDRQKIYSLDVNERKAGGSCCASSSDSSIELAETSSISRKPVNLIELKMNTSIAPNGALVFDSEKSSVVPTTSNYQPSQVVTRLRRNACIIDLRRSSALEDSESLKVPYASSHRLLQDYTELKNNTCIRSDGINSEKTSALAGDKCSVLSAASFQLPHDRPSSPNLEDECDSSNPAVFQFNPKNLIIQEDGTLLYVN